MNVFELMATLSLDTSEYERRLNESEGQAEEKKSSIGQKFKTIATTAGKALATSTAAAASGIAAVTGLAVKGYAEYEQLAGGVKKLFGDEVAKTVISNAEKAYEASGKSTNEYLSTLTSFSASLIKSLDGDTAKAAAQADKAITDIADNVNTFGTSVESVENAYKGFAKANYTMLDNLSLGYAGTKEGMQQLLDDAEKFSGIKYDISSYSDIVDAIHEVQDHMGIAGATAAEAAGTIEGSFNMTKAALKNLVLGFSDENANISQLVDNVMTSAGNLASNVVPRIEQVFTGLGKGIQKAVPAVMSAIPGLFGRIVPGFVSSTVSLMSSIGQTAVDNLPKIMDAVKTGLDGLSGIRDMVFGVIDKVGSALPEAIPSLLGKVLPMVTSLSESLRANAGKFVDVGLSFILKLAQGIANSIPTLVAYIPTIVTNIAGIINDNAPKILATGVKIIVTLVKGIITAIPTIISNMPKIIKAIISVIQAFNWLNLGKQIITAFKNGILALRGAVSGAGKNIFNAVVNAIKALPSKLLGLAKNGISSFKGALAGGAGLVRAAAQTILNGIVTVITSLPGKLVSLATKAVTSFKSKFTSIDWGSVGSNIISGIVRGITASAGRIAEAAKNAAKNAFNKAKSFLGIHSPSKLFRDKIGSMISEGMALGIEENDAPIKAMAKLSDDLSSTADITTSATPKSVIKSDTTALEELVEKIIEQLDQSEKRIYTAVLRVLSNLGIKYDDREIARLVKKYA